MGLNFLYHSDFKLCDVLRAARDLGFTKQGEMFSGEPTLIIIINPLKNTIFSLGLLTQIETFVSFDMTY